MRFLCCRYAGDAEGKGGIYNFVTKRGLCHGKGAKISWTQACLCDCSRLAGGALQAAQVTGRAGCIEEHLINWNVLCQCPGRYRIASTVVSS